MRLEGVCKAYGDKTVLSGFDMEAENGGVTWIMGVSGCGKTTLLRIIAGLEEYEGSITDMPKGKISMAFQEDRLFEELSPLENCLLAGGKRGSKCSEMLMAAGLSEEDIKRPSGQLSGGMKRRTAIVRALCADFGLLLLDEPFGGLDGMTKAQTAELVIRECRGKTIIAVTHDPEDIKLIGGNIIRLTM
ncbi:MAG: ATP-binding cassette domain-containing protein [Huintestinicola sp.]